MQTIPDSLRQNILERFHTSRRPSVAVDIDDRGRVGFWNWDRSHFIPCFDSIAAGLKELSQPPVPHFPEDALGLGYFNA